MDNFEKDIGKVSLYLSLIISISSLSDRTSSLIHISIKENVQPRSELLNLKERLPVDKKTNHHRFEIVSGNNKLRNLLQLNTLTGSFHQISSVDREELCQSNDSECNHTIIISCGSVLFEIIFTIIDENDEIPTFPKQEVELSVLEDVGIGHLIDLPVASDLDSPRYGISNYKIEYNSKSQYAHEKFEQFFRMEKHKDNNGRSIQPQLKLLKALDREQTAKYTFTVVALDTEEMKGQVNIILHVEDVNDNIPQWLGLPYQISLNECTITREIFKLKATDADDQNSKNSKLDFKIDSSKLTNLRDLSRIFYISGDNLVLIDGGLKGRAETRLKIPLKVTDGGGLQNTTDLTIHVKDCNDFAPQISITSRSAKVKENKKSQEILTLLTVKDEDLELNCEFTCYLNDTSYLKLREVMSRSMSTTNEKLKKGMITIYQIETTEQNSFDREEVDFYSVLVICSDRGTPSLTSSQQFNVVIQDENDNYPVFQRSQYSFEIAENSISNSEIGSVSAPDSDYGENSRIKYTLDEFGSRFFSVNGFGLIVTKQRFDRELTAMYNFTVTASDHGKPNKSSASKATVKILDVNDCKPVFKTNHHFNIVESYGKMAIHRNLGLIEAIDNDEGKNGLVWYSIGTTSQSSDEIETEKGKRKTFNAQITKTGKLSIYGVVDREEHTTIFIDVIARDHGSPSLSTITTVTVTVLDLNDNKPIFSFPSSASGAFVNVSADCEVGYLLAKLEAVDSDHGLNGSVLFELVGNESLSPVSIEKDGRVILRESIKMHHQKAIQSDRILVRATDQSEESPQSEVGSLILRYIWPTKGYPNLYSNIGKKSYNKSPERYPNDDIDTKYYNSSYIIILYGLAAVVFIVFLVVLCVLIYFYSAGRSLNGIMERKQSVKSQNIKASFPNNQSNFMESIPFDTSGHNEIYGYQHITETKPDSDSPYRTEYNEWLDQILKVKSCKTKYIGGGGALYQMQNIDTSYMQLMSNPSSSRCQTYTPININSSSIEKYSPTSFNLLNSYSPQSHQNTAVLSTAWYSPIGSMPLIADDRPNEAERTYKHKSRTLSSILKRKSSNNKDTKSQSLSSIESKSSEKISKSQADTRFIVSKNIQQKTQSKINENYISSSFV